MPPDAPLHDLTRDETFAHHRDGASARAAG